MTRATLAAIGITLAAAAASPAHACSRPGGKPSLAERIDAAEVVFIGRVVSGNERHVVATPGDPPAAYIESRIVVVERLKGDVSHEVVVHHPVADMCDLGLFPGWNYVVFVDRDDTEVVAGVTLQWVGDSVPLGTDEDMEDEDAELAAIRTHLKQSTTKADP